MKPFAWSLSALKSYETCGFRHWKTKVKKEYEEPVSDAMSWGRAVHEAAEERIRKKTPLPKGMGAIEPFAEKLDRFGGKLLTEHKMALTKDFEPTGYFAKDVWLRSASDVIGINKKGTAGFIIDWKTGKIDNDPLQLDLCAFSSFQYFPKLEKITAFYVWLKEDETGPREEYTRENASFLWGGLNPRVRKFQNAYEQGEWQKNPSGLCKRHCPVIECEHNGRRN